MLWVTELLLAIKYRSCGGQQRVTSLRVRICCIDMEANRWNTKQVTEGKRKTDEAQFLQLWRGGSMLSWGGSMLRWGFCVLPCWQWQKHGQTGLIQRYHVNSKRNAVTTLSSLQWLWEKWNRGHYKRGREEEWQDILVQYCKDANGK